jgi:hypothetical protein
VTFVVSRIRFQIRVYPRSSAVSFCSSDLGDSSPHYASCGSAKQMILSTSKRNPAQAFGFSVFQLPDYPITQFCLLIQRTGFRRREHIRTISCVSVFLPDLTSHSEVVRRALCRHWNGATVITSAETILDLI